MKLLVCDDCHDAVAMSVRLRYCLCGMTSGRYVDRNEHLVEVWGPARVIGLAQELLYGNVSSATSYDCTISDNVVLKDLKALGAAERKPK